MNADDVAALYRELEDLGMRVWVDGGWGVDSLLGAETRAHKDLDIAVEEKDVLRLRKLLEGKGYGEIRREEARPWNFVLGDADGKEIDFHVIVLDSEGNGIYGPPEKGEMYPAAALTGTGVISGRKVRCISPEWAVKFHSGYQLTEKDFRDASAFCEKFGIALPQGFAKFK